MYEPVQSCTRCGAGLTLEDLRSKTECPYCHTVYPHKAQAEQHAQVVAKVMQNMAGPAGVPQVPWQVPQASPFAPPGVNPYAPVPPGPYANPAALAAMQANNVANIGRTITFVVVGVVVASFVLTGVVIALVFLA